MWLSCLVKNMILYIHVWKSGSNFNWDESDRTEVKASPLLGSYFPPRCKCMPWSYFRRWWVIWFPPPTLCFWCFLSLQNWSVISRTRHDRSTSHRSQRCCGWMWMCLLSHREGSGYPVCLQRKVMGEGGSILPQTREMDLSQQPRTGLVLAEV